MYDSMAGEFDFFALELFICVEQVQELDERGLLVFHVWELLALDVVISMGTFI